jgi:hypothetical protein
MKESDDTVREMAFRFLLEHKSKYYDKIDFENFPGVEFIPAIRPDGSEFLARHSQVRDSEF